MVDIVIQRRRNVGDRLQLQIQADKAIYTVWVVPARDMNAAITGYRIWIGNGTHIAADEEKAIQAALAAIRRLRPSSEPSTHST